MKKIFPAIILLNVLGILAAPTVFAVEAINPGVTTCRLTHDITVNGVSCGALNSPCNIETGPNCGSCCLMNTVYTITDWFFFIVMALAIIFILIGAISFLTAGGSPEKASTGRQYLIFAAIGILIALLARVLPGMIKSIVGLS
jgi:hypothetical protein